MQRKEVEFELQQQGEWLLVSGTAEISRLLYDVGTGEYNDTEALPDLVQVKVDWRLARQ